MNSYFVRRNTTSSNYEQYWEGLQKDPDGIERDRTSSAEYTKFAENTKEEIAFLNGLKGCKIIDVGCGVGYLLAALGEQWEKYGVEISEFAANKASKFGEIYIGELEQQKFNSNYFDVVVVYHVIEHVKDPIGLIKEIHRILKDGGTLLLGTPDFDSACARRFGNNYRLLHDKTHISLFSRESMCRMLRDYGFYIDRIECPFFDTEYFTKENLLRLFDTTKMSPPFYGNFLTFYCHKGGKYESS